MNKKFRLITTVFSLTLAFALMVVGVFAASPAQVGVVGSISFNSETVHATLNVFTKLGDAPPVNEKTTKWERTGDGFQGDVPVSLQPVNLNDQVYTYVLTVQIKNDFTAGSGNNLTISYSNAILNADLPKGLTMVESVPAQTLAPQATYTATFTYTLNTYQANDFSNISFIDMFFDIQLEV